MERTPSQTVGPFFHEALRWQDGGPANAGGGAPRVVLSGRIFDGAAEPVGDAMLEAWQPTCLARTETQKDGTFRIETAMPRGALPYLDIAIFARGLLKPLRTRVYLAAEDKVRGEPLLAGIASPARLATLVACPAGEAEYRWEVHLQGEGETVFFAT